MRSFSAAVACRKVKVGAGPRLHIFFSQCGAFVMLSRGLDYFGGLREVIMISDAAHAIPVQVNRNGLRTIAVGS